jgi:hypothetical protein
MGQTLTVEAIKQIEEQDLACLYINMTALENVFTLIESGGVGEKFSLVGEKFKKEIDTLYDKYKPLDLAWGFIYIWDKNCQLNNDLDCRIMDNKVQRCLDDLDLSVYWKKQKPACRIRNYSQSYQKID